MIRPTVLDVQGIDDPRELWQALHPARTDGRCAWIRLGGLPAESDGHHRGLMRELGRFGLGSEVLAAPPELAVLDWSTVQGCTADGLALFAVAARELVSRGTSVVACGPGDGEIAGALHGTGLRDACEGVRWVACGAGAPRRLRVLGPASLFGTGADSGAHGRFVGQLYQALRMVQMEMDRVNRVVSTTVDLLQNVLAHSGAQHACAVALVHPRRRPPEVEVGIADGGRGIVSGVLSQERHSWLLSFTDGTVTSAALTHGLSGRAEDDGGGALAGLIRGLIRECGATVVVRSGAALLRLNPPDGRCAPCNLSCGWGTQTLIRVRTRA